VGKRGAAWLFDRHGPEVLAAIDEDPERRLGEVPGIGRAKLGAAVRSWQAQAELRAVRLFLEEHGVPAAAAARIYRHFGSSSVDLLREDPYALTELDGIGWATADALARALGTPADAPGRLDAGVVHALELAESDGHCFLPRGELAARAQELLGADVEPRLDALALGGRIVVESGRVWEARMHQTERTLARRVRELLDAEPALGIDDPERPSDGAFVPSDAQWAVVERVLSGRLTILTGGPGTGKTQTMRALVDLLAAERRRVRLCAPTGKAARRLVDEASMLDVRLAAALLDAVGPRTHVLLVGDPDQLSPVGAGRVLEDLLDAGTVPTVRLTEVFRQAARSMIVRAAHAVNAGRHPPVAPDEGDVHDFFLIGRTDPGAIFAEVCELAAERLPRHYGIHPAEVQVLAPMHKGPLGIDAFNEALRARLNPDGKAVPGTGLRLGDRVMQVVNNHERELMNGELGVLVSHDAERDQVIFAGDDGRRVRLDTRETETLRLAHAISVHKAQGSQMPVVVLPLHRAHRIMLTRNLLYTGLTRAQRAAVLVGEPEAIGHALGRTDARRRHTALEELVR
jgi:exodeoxyribonuclease V alpha subunit